MAVAAARDAARRTSQMPRRVHRFQRAKAHFAVVALLALPGCSSIGDLGRLQQPVVADNLHSWVGQAAATHSGAPISLLNLTDDERTLRDLAFPLIEPPYDRIRWDAVVYEYGQKRDFKKALWVVDTGAYYRHLIAANYRSSAGRYNQLIDDIRNDIVRIGPFFDLAHRVVELDKKREASMNLLPDVAPPDRANALARVGENMLTIGWVQYSLAKRAASYRFTLDHLVVTEPEDIAAQADTALALLQQQIAASQFVPDPPFAAPIGVAAGEPPAIVK
jgi:hypothetical protein